MKTIIQVHREGKWFIAADLVTNIAHQGSTEDEAVQNLTKELQDHYRLLIESAPKDKKIAIVDIDVSGMEKRVRPGNTIV
jgi:predicted RNase H-like HicB family nuclease